MVLDGVVLLAAPSSRSQAYLQRLVVSDLLPGQVIVMGAESPAIPVPQAIPSACQSVMLPDLAEPLSITCQKAGIPLVCCTAMDVNAGEIFEALRATGPRFVIYSGHGGQIVGSRLLCSGPRFLHLHSGWLPEYRGSTTVYYALLNGERPAATALLLDPGIDTGAVLARRHYPRPPAGLDIDRLYDAAIRSDLLAQVMQDYARTGELRILEEQDRAAGQTYYVIHPVLKHLAILSLGTDTSNVAAVYMATDCIDK